MANVMGDDSKGGRGLVKTIGRIASRGGASAKPPVDQQPPLTRDYAQRESTDTFPRAYPRFGRNVGRR